MVAAGTGEGGAAAGIMTVFEAGDSHMKDSIVAAGSAVEESSMVAADSTAVAADSTAVAADFTAAAGSMAATDSEAGFHNSWPSELPTAGGDNCQPSFLFFGATRRRLRLRAP
jgi:hypothetical protein